MGIFRRTFGAMHRPYLIRAYVIGAVFFAAIAWLDLQAPDPHGLVDQYVKLGYAALSALLFPFAKMVWDELRDLAMGGNVFFLNAIILLFLKAMVNVALFVLAPFVAPLGLLYLWYRTRDGAPGDGGPAA